MIGHKKTKATEIYFDTEINSIRATYSGFANQQEWKEHFEHAVDLIKKYKPKAWITDATLAKVISSENQKYFNEVFVPNPAVKFIKKNASVIPKDIFSELSSKSMLAHMHEQPKIEEQGLKTEYFDSLTKAKEWVMA